MNKFNNKSKVFMAFGKAVASTEASEGSFARYIGVGSCYVHGVNLTKKELESFYGRELSFDPEEGYKGIYENNGKKTEFVRLSFAISTDPDKCDGIDIKAIHTITLSKEAQYNGDQTKLKVIDKYGRTCWVTTEQFKAKEVPMYSNGPANIDKNYRPCYRGEEELTQFIKTYLGIGNVMDYKNGSWVMKENPEDFECSLEKIQDYFKGDVKEVKEALALMPKNKVKVLFGVKTKDDGKLLQVTYPDMVLRNNSSKYDNLAKQVEDAKAAGRYSTVEFEVSDLHEYNPTANDSSMEQATTTVDPFAM